ncbi:MAG: DUF3177 family protein [Sphaerospermopsis sp. SIO1G1]|nr:DUF3177 family protein [Sphaerospermopsis sp. SIO1G1]
MPQVWFRPYIWMDYRLALLFTLFIPVILLIWAFVQRSDAIQRLLRIYCRVAILSAITVYLFIGGLPISFLSSLMSRILIPISLWFWVDLNDEIDYLPKSPLKLFFTSWRWAMTVYSFLGAISLLPFLNCTFSGTAFRSSFCSVWSEPSLMFKDYFHNNSKPAFLGFLGIVALVIYVIYLSYFVFVKLGKHGRSATQ